MRYVTASEFQKNFGDFKQIAQSEPISITSNGRESVVLLSAKEYGALQHSNKTPRTIAEGEVTEEFKDILREFMDKHGDVLKGLAK